MTTSTLTYGSRAASTFGLEQGGSCKKSARQTSCNCQADFLQLPPCSKPAWIEDHVYANTSGFFITRCCFANCMTIIRHEARCSRSPGLSVMLRTYGAFCTGACSQLHTVKLVWSVYLMPCMHRLLVVLLCR